MKKLFIMLMVIALAMPAAALADLPDISGLSHDELIQLNYQIQLRLFSEQLVNGVEVPPGTYIVGEDIPAGSYRLETKGQSVNYILYDGNKKIIGSGIAGKAFDTMIIGKLVLDEGTLIEINYASFTFYPYAGLFN